MVSVPLVCMCKRLTRIYLLHELFARFQCMCDSCQIMFHCQYWNKKKSKRHCQPRTSNQGKNGNLVNLIILCDTNLCVRVKIHPFGIWSALQLFKRRIDVKHISTCHVYIWIIIVLLLCADAEPLMLDICMLVRGFVSNLCLNNCRPPFGMQNVI